MYVFCVPVYYCYCLMYLSTNLTVWSQLHAYTTNTHTWAWGRDQTLKLKKYRKQLATSQPCCRFHTMEQAERSKQKERKKKPLFNFPSFIHSFIYMRFIQHHHHHYTTIIFSLSLSLFPTSVRLSLVTTLNTLFHVQHSYSGI